jgi:hypothetical protein
MPCSYIIDKERRLVISTGVGLVTFEEMKAHQNKLLGDPDFRAEFNQLIDATAVMKIELSRDAAEEITSRNIFSISSRRALVATKPAIFGTGRLLMTYLEMSSQPSETNVFYGLAPALEWLGVKDLSISSKSMEAKTGT